MKSRGLFSIISYKNFLAGVLQALVLVLSLVLAACGGEPAATAPASLPPRASSPAAVTAGTAPGATAGALPVTSGPVTSAVAPVQAGISPAPTPTAAEKPYPASTAGTPPSPTPAGAIVPGQQTLNMAWGEINTLDPALASDTTTSFVLRQLYTGLVTLDKNFNVVPELAAQMPDLSENGTLYTFKLRQGAKFLSGREITAEDFKFSFERAADPKLAAPDYSSALPAVTYMTDIVGVREKLEGKASEVSGVRVKDNYTLQIKLDAPKPQFLAKMTYNVFFVVNKEAVSRGFEPVDGSGPFKLVEYKRNQYIRLERNENYYLGAPRLLRVNLALGANATNSQVQYEQGRLDIVNVGGSDAERVLDRASPLNRELVVRPQLAVQYLAFNTRLKPFDDPKVRQAFSLVVDRPRIARAMFENKVQPATGILPPGLPGYSSKPGPLVYDISRARDLIAQSSYRRPENLPRITLYSTGDALSRVLQEVYKQAFGLDIEVRYYDYKDFLSGLNARQFPMYLYGWVADYPDPENFLRSLLGSGSAFNDTGYNNTRFDDLMKQGDQQPTAAQRLSLYSQAEQLALIDAPLLPIYHDVSYTLVKSYVKGLDITEAGIWTLKDVYILK